MIYWLAFVMKAKLMLVLTLYLFATRLNKEEFNSLIATQATDQWYEMQDLIVRETIPQLIAVSETYILIYERVDESMPQLQPQPKKQ